jgi:hypothetical protein
VNLMRSMTQREYEARMAWLDEELNNPSRTDWYLMQIAAEVRKSVVKDPSSVKLPSMKLKSSSPEPAKPITREEATARSKSRWFGMLSVKKDK